MEQDARSRAAPSRTQITSAIWFGFLSPRRAGELLAHTPLSPILLNYAAAWLLLAPSILLLSIWADTRTWGYLPAPVTVYGMTERTWAEVWTDWQAAGTLGQGTTLLLAMFGVETLLTLLMTWILYPTVRRGTSAMAALRGSFSAVVAAAGCILIAVWLVGTCIVLAGDSLKEWPSLWAFPATASGVALVTLVMVNAARGARRAIPLPLQAPVCTRCGYDLTHFPASGRCPECGDDLQRSHSHEPETVLLREDYLLSLAVLLQPRRFYRRIRQRSGEHQAHCFATIQYTVIMITSLVWLLLVFAGADLLTDSESIPVMVFLTLAIGLAGWGLNRLVGTIAITVMYSRRLLLNPAVGLKLVCYESVFVWFFCLFDGSVISTFVIADDSMWISKLLGWTPWGVPVEPLLLLGGNVVIILLWFWRYWRILPSIRYANE